MMLVRCGAFRTLPLAVSAAYGTLPGGLNGLCREDSTTIVEMNFIFTLCTGTWEYDINWHKINDNEYTAVVDDATVVLHCTSGECWLSVDREATGKHLVPKSAHVDLLWDIVTKLSEINRHANLTSLEKSYIHVLMKNTADKTVVWKKLGDFCYVADASEACVTLYSYPDYLLSVCIPDVESRVLQDSNLLSKLWKTVIKHSSIDAVEEYMKEVIKEDCATNGVK